MPPLPRHPLLSKSPQRRVQDSQLASNRDGSVSPSKSQEKQKDKIDEINNGNNMSPSIRKIHLHLEVTEIYCPLGVHRRITIYYHMLY